jgi:hypothetical protein
MTVGRNYYSLKSGIRSHVTIVTVSSEVLTAVTMKMAVFWVVQPCGLVYTSWYMVLVLVLVCTGLIMPVYTAMKPRRQPSSLLQ